MLLQSLELRSDLDLLKQVERIALKQVQLNNDYEAAAERGMTELDYGLSHYVFDQCQNCQLVRLYSIFHYYGCLSAAAGFCSRTLPAQPIAVRKLLAR
eukprot:SAG31_NODE_929_length_10926_cov_8.162834_11_plen_98_part_00